LKSQLDAAADASKAKDAQDATKNQALSA